MNETTHLDQTFDKISFTEQDLKNGEFERCIFKQCDFSQSNLSRLRFLDCEFINCNLAMVKFNRTSLNNAIFKGCKLLGINFSECEDFLFSVYFEDCVLDYASFSHKKMAKTKFSNTSMKDVNFADANLTSAVFLNCDLSRAVFNKTILKHANFETARNYAFDPENNDIKKAKFSLHGLPGLLLKHDIVVE